MLPTSTKIDKPAVLNQSKVAGRPKSQEKRKQILFCAGELFLEQGYDRTSMDAVAKQSGVSKQTVYSHFQNKDVLYTAVIEGKCEEYRIADAALSAQNNSLDDILQDIASSFIHLLNDKRVIAMHSVIIGESKNNTHVAALFYEAGPLHSIRVVTDLLKSHPDCQLTTENAKETAIDFFNLLKSDYHMLSMLGLPYEQSEQQLNNYAKKVVVKTLKIIEIYR
ncbi:MAG: TetR/AcrR family transcriptional repressor of mexJK operon [Glaciecola sp.]|jgi:TetR/AcrR family transcriptional repressor of mexJK operon